MKNFDPVNFQADLLLLLRELQNFVNPGDAEQAYLSFHKKYQAIVNKHAPIQILTRKQQELEHKRIARAQQRRIEETQKIQ